VIGTPAELDAVSIADLRAFAARYYRPNNATLVVCGAFDPKVLKPIVADLFGKIPPGPKHEPRAFPFRKVGKDRRVDVAAAVPAPMVLAAWVGPPPNADGYWELAMALPGFEGQLWHHLVVDSKIADEVDVDVDPGRLGSLVTATVRLKKGESTSSARSAIDEALSNTSRWGRVWDWPSFGDDKSRFMVRRVSNLEDVEYRAQRILFDLDYYDVADGMQSELKRIQALRAADVSAALEAFLVDRARVTVVVEPDRSAPISGRIK
jgi:zinc protease